MHRNERPGSCILTLVTSLLLVPSACVTSGPETRPAPAFLDCVMCPEMVVVPAGSFTMGSPRSEADGDDDERPRRTVTIGSSFAVGVHEVTFAEWDACVVAGGCSLYRPDDRGWGRGSHPVINVSWEDAQEYVRWLSEQTGKLYRLLSEAEWEYVARAETQTARYWGEGESEQCRYANGDDSHVRCSDGYAETAPVGTFERNAFGLHDVIGNVREWTEDHWNFDHRGGPMDGRARGFGDFRTRVLRGGSWLSRPADLRSASRARLPADLRSSLVGFRVARAPD